VLPFSLFYNIPNLIVWTSLCFRVDTVLGLTDIAIAQNLMLKLFAKSVNGQFVSASQHAGKIIKYKNPTVLVVCNFLHSKTPDILLESISDS